MGGVRAETRTENERKGVRKREGERMKERARWNHRKAEKAVRARGD